MYISEIQKKNQKIFWVLKKIPFDLISWNTHFYRERIIPIMSQYVNKQSEDFRYY